VRPAVELDLQRAREDERELVVGMVVRWDLRVPRLDPVEGDHRVVGPDGGPLEDPGGDGLARQVGE
jgi:hypothetical protein